MIRRSSRRRLTRITINHTLIMTLSVLAFGVSQSYWVGLAAVFVAGLAMTTSGISAQTLVQTSVDPIMRGRVMAFLRHGVLGRAPALGALIAGWFATRVGFHAPVIAGALRLYRGAAWRGCG